MVEQKRHPGPWLTYWRKIVRFDAGKLEPWLALRNTAGVLVPLAAGIVSGKPLSGLAASLGALQVAYSDGHDPYPSRGKRMLLSSLLCSVAVLAGVLASKHHVLAVVLVSIWAFGAGMAVAFGESAESLGVVSLVTLVVFAGAPAARTQAGALDPALLAFAGGLLQTALSLAFWPIQRYAPEHRAIAQFYQELARKVTAHVDPEHPLDVGSETAGTQWVLASLSGDRTDEAEHYVFLVNQAERIRLSLLVLGRLRRRLSHTDEGAADVNELLAFLRIASKLLALIADSLRGGQAPSSVTELLRSLDSAAARYRGRRKSQLASVLSLSRAASVQMDALSGQLRAAVDLAMTLTSGGGLKAGLGSLAPWKPRIQDNVVEKFRANLTLRSPAFRHALRLVLSLAVGEVLALSIARGRTYWLPMTVVLVLKPEFAETLSRGLLRIAGTMAGLLIATELFHLVPFSSVSLLTMIACSFFLMRWIGPANYGVFAAAVSAMIVLLSVLTGATPREVISQRGLMTLLGGSIGLAGYLIWPTWERTQVRETLAALLDAYRRYFKVTLRAYDPAASQDPTLLSNARVAARLARSNAETSLARLRAEPGTPAKLANMVSSMLASSHRFAYAVMGMEGSASLPLTAGQWEELSRFEQDVELSLELLACQLRAGKVHLPQVPDLRERHHELLQTLIASAKGGELLAHDADQIINSLNTLKEQIFRWIGKQRALATEPV